MSHQTSNKEWRKALKERFGNDVKMAKPKKDLVVALLDNKQVGEWNGKIGRIDDK
jgi:hypothetical protein